MALGSRATLQHLGTVIFTHVPFLFCQQSHFRFWLQWGAVTTAMSLSHPVPLILDPLHKRILMFRPLLFTFMISGWAELFWPGCKLNFIILLLRNSTTHWGMYLTKHCFLKKRKLCSQKVLLNGCEIRLALQPSEPTRMFQLFHTWNPYQNDFPHKKC